MAGRLWCWAREDCWSTKREPLEERGVEFISAVRPCSPVEWTPERILACPGRQRPLLPQPAFPGYRAFSSLLLPARPCISRVGGTPMTKVHARYAHTRILPNSLSPTYSFPSSLGPIFVSSLRFFSNFGEKSKHEDRLKAQRVLVIIFGYWRVFFSSRRILVDVTIESRGYPLVNLNTYRQLVFNLTLENVMSCASWRASTW